MSCWKCTPLCELCKHKLIKCPSCGVDNLLIAKKCVICGCDLTDDMKAESKRRWLEAKRVREAAARGDDGP